MTVAEWERWADAQFALFRRALANDGIEITGFRPVVLIGYDDQGSNGAGWMNASDG